MCAKIFFSNIINILHILYIVCKQIKLGFVLSHLNHLCCTFGNLKSCNNIFTSENTAIFFPYHRMYDYQ